MSPRGFNTNQIFLFICFLVSLKTVFSVPIDYCLEPLNQADCNLEPTPVFSYYKEGSRCEIQFWRGCPTWNKFDTEFDCSHHCIGKLSSYSDSGSLENLIPYKKGDVTLAEVKDPCKSKLNVKPCNGTRAQVYTFKNGKCIIATWMGCHSPNKFDDEASCVKTCVTKNHTDSQWRDELYHLSTHDIQVLNEILDDFIHPYEAIDEPPTEPLLFVEETSEATNKNVSETTTESTTKSTVESPTEGTTESTTKSTMKSTTESTTKSTTEVTTESTTESTTKSTTEITTESTTESTTKSVSETTTAETTAMSIGLPEATAGLG